MAAQRGSEEWLRESFKRPIVSLDDTYLDAFLELARMDGVKLLDWTTRGTPHPDILHGALQVQPDQAGKVFERLGGLQDWIRHEWFPIGIIDPDGFIVNFSNQKQLGR